MNENQLETIQEFKERIFRISNWAKNNLDVSREQYGRLADYQRVVEKLELSLKKLGHIPQEEVGAVLDAFNDLYILHYTFSTLRRVEHPRFLETAKKVLKGNARVINEKDPSARNFQFELFLAAVFNEYFIVKFDVEDFTFQVRGKNVGVECKRISGSRKTVVEDKVKEAAGQLLEKSSKGLVNYGLIAVQVDKLWNDGSKMLTGSDGDEIMTFADKQMDEFLNKHSAAWVGKFTSTSIIGIIVTLVCPGIDKGTGAMRSVVRHVGINFTISKPVVSEQHRTFMEIGKSLRRYGGN